MSTPIDLAAAGGAAISARRALDDRWGMLLELSGVLRVDAASPAAGPRIRVANLSGGELRWTQPTGARGTAAPAGTVELALPDPGRPACLQVAVAQALGVTLTVSLVGQPPRYRAIAQALVSS
jgi:hypothetical protein